ncbi:hypothetical protein GCM10010353_47490 [Streptomyces chryseus]|nr:hypothetical protein GCM10010353_47490 [Streptomyces chryseus]
MPDITRTPPGAVTDERATPVLDLRVGGLHLTVQRIPVGLLLMLTALSGSGITGWWITQ